MVVAILRGLFLVAATISIISCTDDLRDIDSRTDRLIRERSLVLGRSNESLAPSRAGGDPGRSRSAGLETSPATVNPPSGTLRFAPADEARDVNARLERFYAPSGSEQIFTLQDALRQTHLTAREYLAAEEDYVLAAVRLLVSKYAFAPRFLANASAGLTSAGVDGAYQTPLRILGELGVAQRLPDGGQVAARLVWDATEELREAATDRYTQASSLELSAAIPLLRGAGPAAREDLIQSERNLVYAARTFEQFRRALLVNIAADYFDLVQQRAAIVNQQRRLDGLLKLEERIGALVEAGRLAEFERNIASNQVLQARSSLANQSEAYQLALDRFTIRLGLPVDRGLTIAPVEFHLPEPETTPEAAAEAALSYRLDLQTTRDRADDARRGVEVARNGTLPDLGFAAGVTARTQPGARVGGLIFETDDFIYSGSVTFGLPLDRENERLALRRAIIGLERAGRDVAESRDRVVVEARSRVREIDRARFNLKLAEQAVYINKRRLEEQDLKRAEVTAQQIVDAQNDLLRAENDRDQARTDLRNAVLGYLLTTALLRVDREGQLIALPGMETSAGAAPAPPATEP